jgi:hypothetical protein
MSSSDRREVGMSLNSIRRERRRRRTQAIPTIRNVETALAPLMVSTPERRERAKPMFGAPRGEVAAMP